MRVPMRVPSAVPGGRAPLAPHWILIGLAPVCMPLVSRGRIVGPLSYDTCKEVLVPPPKQKLAVFINRL